MNNEVIKRLEALRESMRMVGIDAYIVPSSDPHKSEYVADRFKSRAYITGFTGSAGLAIITKEQCHLWTDGRYFIQAENELAGTGITLQKMGEPGVKTYTEWLDDFVESDMTIGYDERVFSVLEIEALKQDIHAEDINFDGSHDLFNRIWNDRPDLPFSSTYVHELQYTGLTVQEKLTLVRKDMKKYYADYYIISSLNDIAWLLNFRGDDVLYTPVTYSFALISKDDVHIYIHQKQLSPDVNEHLGKASVIQRPYDHIYLDIENIKDGASVILDPKHINAGLMNKIDASAKVIRQDELTAHIKACMNETEIKNLKHCQIKDGVALVKCLNWLDKSVGKESISELAVADKLEGFRKEQPLFIEPSFNTISAYESNAAMMHYSTDPNNSPLIDAKGFLLVDSGGQYFDGTTDITRTIVLGELSDEAKTDFTLVLKSHINLARFVFLKGTAGNEMDAIARQPIWQARKDYKCGTGHGVGYLLGVHEGVQRIAKRAKPIPMELGMIITNEPGIYIEGNYGIRTENTLLVVEDCTNSDGTFYRFETISHCPIDRRAIVVEMLSLEEKQWLNDYHRNVFEVLSPGLNNEESAWLKEMTAEI